MKGFLVSNSHRFLAIIPARGNSKRLPNKNLRELKDKPLINWTIEAAKNSKYITNVMVSTDSEQIAEIAKEAGAEMPFLRPSYLAEDHTTTYDTVEHTVLFYKEKLHKEFDFIVLLQPTSPLRSSHDIDKAIETLRDKKADAIVSVNEVEHSPLWTNTLPKSGDMSHFLPDKIKNTRSQELAKYVRLNGAIYICDTNRLLEEKTFYIKDNIFAYEMLIKHSIDIDNITDLKLAELLIDEGVLNDI
jgi:CMP-N-acetylneuraminic acid synthetase